jgi:hypothetical protein
MRVLVSAKTIAEGSVEIKERRAKKEDSEIMKTSAFLKSYTVEC